ncbi:ribbon-helix-helix protein, CopG family [Saccharopolyspora sp. K220]|uniref:ribbon-helix-helix protein, CopG family n=1 Tax=Saccharopolyspora soli TaxID=2926618 RepID=UPI001F569D3C|nr:ribbon-helix-helix protein, CopG family [Saccharopolyspora soli]MCI2416264.1 ribbon-helix-helix protein, CopG family [Saccharopolyspora soli]
MRTTITIDDQLLDQLKLRAARERTTVSALIEDDVRMGELRRAQREAPERNRFRLPTFDLGEPKPGVDLNDNAAVVEFMERDE